jgi:hypothetical protein
MKRDVLFVLVILIVSALAIGINTVSSVGEVTYCCEKSVGGAWCQNSPPAVCNDNYRSVPTSCEATSYCRLGTCVNSQEGTCMENTPERVCEDSNGVWIEGEPDEIPQCQLGCCLIGDQAAFVTQTRCKRLSSIYGVETNYRTDMQSEAECIASASPEVKGACVFDRDFERTCSFLTKRECQEMEASASEDTNIEFHEGFLCSAETLATNCGPTEKTACVEDRDAVYFIDSCGNLANIYDASKINSKDYWSKVYEEDESCSPNSANANSASCGNCDYLLGSTCKVYERGDTRMTRPTYGDNICADLSCRYEGNTYQHGETWCSGSEGVEDNLPGSEHVRMVCYNGDVTAEYCSSFRQEVCLESDIDGFSTAACRVNRWQDCYVQDNIEDCENIDKRDCQWLEGRSLLKDESGKDLVVDEDGYLVEKEDEDDERESAACVPLYAPGFDFWNPEGEAEELCMFASNDCVVTFKRGLFGKITGGEWDCKENCECLGDDWEEEMQNLCIALGDCGSSTNYEGEKGYHDGEAVVVEGYGEDEAPAEDQ